MTDCYRTLPTIIGNSRKTGAIILTKIAEICDPRQNSGPIAIRIGIFRRRDRPSLLLGGDPGPEFYRILENSRSGSCAEIVKICDFLTNPDRRSVGIGIYDEATAGCFDVRVGGNRRPCWGNLINEVQIRRRISFGNPDIGALGMLGIYSASGSIFEIFDSCRSGITHQIAKFCHFCHISGRYICRF